MIEGLSHFALMTFMTFPTSSDNLGLYNTGGDFAQNHGNIDLGGLPTIPHALRD